MKTILYIFIGGGLGSVFRFLVSRYTAQFFKLGTFPMGTLVVNVLGCFLIGLLSNSLIKQESDVIRYFFIVGLCGGFTTFSTFSYENLILWQNQDYATLFSYVVASLVLGFWAVYLGFKVG
ncbi:fluoride efflux transporter CrcB [Riemerella anatipestifer]|nr:fluoride efflux transporter CrcB [Riemerella anatipestifer]